MKTMKERMLTGDLYIPSLTEGLRDLSIKGKKLAQQYNRLDFDDLHGATCLCGLRSSYNDWRRLLCEF